MVHIRQPFFSIAAAAIFGALGLMGGMSIMTNSPVVFGGNELNDQTLWSFIGVMFLMAYFSLVHLKED
jgi:hypothetical protein